MANRNDSDSLLKFVLLSQLLTEPEEERRFVVEDLLLAGTFSLLAAKPKVGKSTLSRQMAAAVSTGTPFLGRQTVASPVLHVAIEDHRSELVRSYRKLGVSDGPLYVCDGRVGDDPFGSLEKEIVLRGAGLVILDPIAKFVRMRDISAYGEVSGALEPLIDLARRTDCHITGIHHMGKREGGGADALLGSTALFAAVDSLYLMREEGGLRFLKAQHRYLPSLDEIALTYDSATGRFDLAGGPGSVLTFDKHLQGAAKRILGLMREKWVPRAELLRLANCSATTFARAISSLLEEDVIEVSGSGVKNDPYLYRRNPISELPLGAGTEND